MHFVVVVLRWLGKLCHENAKRLHSLLLNTWTLLFVNTFYLITGRRCWQIVSDMSIFFWWIHHQMPKKVDKQAQYLFLFSHKWMSSTCLRGKTREGLMTMLTVYQRYPANLTSLRLVVWHDNVTQEKKYWISHSTYFVVLFGLGNRGTPTKIVFFLSGEICSVFTFLYLFHCTFRELYLFPHMAMRQISLNFCQSM